jgi:hypothetical protein
MRRYAWVLGGLLLAPLLTGCPFDSKVPLAPPGSEAADPRLAGAWIGIDEEDQDSVTVLVLPFNGVESYVETREKSGDTSRYRVCRLELGGESFLQLNELEAEGKPESFVFARYSFETDRRLRIRFVGETIVPKTLASDAKGLAEFITAHRADPALDDPDLRLLLVRKE